MTFISSWLHTFLAWLIFSLLLPCEGFLAGLLGWEHSRKLQVCHVEPHIQVKGKIYRRYSKGYCYYFARFLHQITLSFLYTWVSTRSVRLACLFLSLQHSASTWYVIHCINNITSLHTYIQCMNTVCALLLLSYCNCYVVVFFGI